MEASKSNFMCVVNNSEQTIWLEFGTWVTPNIQPQSRLKHPVGAEDNGLTIYAGLRSREDWGVVRVGFGETLTVNGRGQFNVTPGTCG
jgi:hypothetical protein